MSKPTRETPPTARFILGQELMARRNLEEHERACEALMLSLSDDGLASILKSLRRFREGKPLPRKVRNILEGVLGNLRGIMTENLRKPPPEGGPAHE